MFLLIFPVLMLQPQLFLQTCLETGVILGVMQSPGSLSCLSKTLHTIAGDTLECCRE